MSVLNKLFIYDVGDIYITINSTDPSEKYGGTWEPFGTGRTLVGIDTSQTEFNTIQKTGGSKHMQAHTHNYARPHMYGNEWSSGNSFFAQNSSTAGGSSTRVTGSSGTGDSGNLQPYITVYMWLRTA